MFAFRKLCYEDASDILFFRLISCYNLLCLFLYIWITLRRKIKFCHALWFDGDLCSLIAWWSILNCVLYILFFCSFVFFFFFTEFFYFVLWVMNFKWRKCFEFFFSWPLFCYEKVLNFLFRLFFILYAVCDFNFNYGNPESRRLI